MIGIGIGIPYRSGAGGGGAAPPFLRYDFTGNMFQGTDETTPVTTASDPVGRINSTGQDDRPLTQGTAGSKPTWNGTDAITLDGSNDWLETRNYTDMPDPDSLILNWRGTVSDISTSPAIYSHTRISGNGFFNIQMMRDGDLRCEMRPIAGSPILRVDLNQYTHVAGARVAITLAFHDGVLDYYVNGIEQATGVAFDQSNATAYEVVAIGCRAVNGGAVVPMPGEIEFVSIEAYS